MNDEDRQSLIEQARELFCLSSDNSIEVDDDAEVSEADDGTWVQAWVWVPKS